jgi:hypothetical protein
MSNAARVGRRSVLVALALAFGLLLGGVTPASGQTQGQTGTLGNAGVLRLRLGSQDHFRFEPASGPAGTQSISPQGACGLQLAGAPSPQLATLTPSSGSVGFVQDAIGVKAGEGNGQNCGRIDGSQALTLNLGAGLDGTLIDFAEIDVELKFSATLVVTGYLVDGTDVSQMAQSTYSSDGSDSGPDSGDGDNYRIRFPEDGSKTTVNRLVFSLQNNIGGASL